MTTHVWIDKPIKPRTAVGHHITAIHPEALPAAVTTLAAHLGPRARHLDVRAGEHLAALLLTAFIGPPASVDDRGQVDLVFDRMAGGLPSWCFGDSELAAVEVKSFAGRFRHAESRMLVGGTHGAVVKPAADVLRESEPLIMRAMHALRRKVEHGTSKNVFLVAHPFDVVTFELFGDVPFLRHALPLLDADVDLDTLWVLWHPATLTMWSRAEQRWTDVLFDVESDGPREVLESNDALQAAEAAFLAAIAYEGEPSPWQFRVTSRSAPPDPPVD